MNIAKLMGAIKALRGASRRYEEGERSGNGPLSHADAQFFQLLRDRLKVEGYSIPELRKLLID